MDSLVCCHHSRGRLRMNRCYLDDGQVSRAVVQHARAVLGPDASVAYHQHHNHASTEIDRFVERSYIFC